MDKETRKVRMTLVGTDGNAFNVMGLFAAHARRQGWPSDELDAVMTEARSGDYSHLLATLMDHIEEPKPEEG